MGRGHLGLHDDSDRTEERLGLVVITSCGHPGVINSVRRAQKVSGVEKVHVIVGGFHLATGTRVVRGLTRGPGLARDGRPEGTGRARARPAVALYLQPARK